MKTLTRSAGKAALIRQRLKKDFGLGARDVSVTCSNYSMGSSVSIKAKSPRAVKVYRQIEAIGNESEDVSRCEQTGEILSGGNCYVRVSIDWDLKKEAVKVLEPILNPMKATAETVGHATNDELKIQLSFTEGRFVVFDVSKDPIPEGRYLGTHFDAYDYDAAIHWAAERLLINGRHPMHGKEPEAKAPEQCGEVELYHHSKTGAELWTVRPSDRLGKDAFSTALQSAKAHGGSYTRAYAPANFPGGFTFPTKEQAQAWIDGAAVSVGQATERKPIKANDPEKLLAMAERLERDAEGKLSDRTENTPKQRRQASFARCEGHQMERAALILRACADSETAPSVTKRDAMQAASKKIESGSGYYDCGFESDEWRDSSELAKQLREIAGLGEDTPEQKADKAKAKELSEIRSCRIEGFFPTPEKIIQRMIEIAGDLDGKTVLDPSCGIGSILDLAKSEGATCYGIESSPRLAAFCQSHGGFKGITMGDFMEEPPRSVDVVLMNPPFERKQAALHVMRAFDWLAEGGTLVAVVPATVADGGQYEFFRAWLGGKDYEFEEIEPGAFSGADSFNKTGVSVSLLTIRK